MGEWEGREFFMTVVRGKYGYSRIVREMHWL
jgi:hypothetical protein